MKQFKTLALIPAMLLAACGGDSDTQTMKEKTTPGAMVYSFPMDGQNDVSPKADIVLRFSHAVVDDEATLAQKIKVAVNGAAVDFNVNIVDDGKSLKLEPATALDSGSNYSVTFAEPLAAEGGRTIATPNAVGEPGIQFNTRGEFSGLAGLGNTADQFGVAWQVPANGSEFKAMDFSTFRLAMTQPVHPEWRKKGGSIELLDKNGDTVPATVLVKGNRITVDPCVADRCGSKEDVLNAGETYTLKLSNLASLTNSAEDNRFSAEYSYTPRDTGPTVMLEQQAVDSNGGAITSVLNDEAVNGVVLNSVLQGVTDSSQQTGSLFAELAYSPSFEANEALPLRIPKGSVLESTSLNVKVGGKVQVLDAATGGKQQTGTIKVTMLSDASGYMSPNPYTDDLNAPRHITLFMDVSMNTEEAQPNAALSQDLMGVELRGIALVQDGVLTIDAIGMVEPNLLGQEFTDSTIAFQLKAATDVNSALDAEDDWLRDLDTTPPQLVSWMPGAEDAIPATRQSMQRPGDPVILFFDEPLDPASIKNGVTLSADNTPVENLNTKLDGTALVINPEGGLKHGVQYRVDVNGLTDLSGNEAVTPPLSFELDRIEELTELENKGFPLALTTYPGYPCETDYADTLDLEAGNFGRCWTADDANAGDLLPVSKMPADRPITVVFSKSIELDSIIKGQTFQVQKVAQEDDGSIVILEEQVSGRLEKSQQRIRFYPDKPWGIGEHYRYVLASSEESNTCNEGEYSSICDTDGAPLKTDLLEGLDDGGDNNGPDHLEIFFTGVEPVQTVFTPLRNLPIRDTNSNLTIDCDSLGSETCLEPFNHNEDGNGGFKPSANAAKLLVAEHHAEEARVGCAVDGEDCPRSKFIYQTYALNTEVVGNTTDPDTGRDAVEVLLYPTQLATTSLDVHLSLLSTVSTTGPQVLRMRYAKDDPSCEGDACPRNSLIPGLITENDQGETIFKTTVDLYLDAPELTAEASILGVPIELPLEHNLFAYPFTLELQGRVIFFDDGRMQVEQLNSNIPEINVEATALSFIDTEIPLLIPEQGVYLNFISNPVKDLPAQYEQQTAQ